MKIFSDDKISIERITVGVINTNCYILFPTVAGSDKERTGCIIDPGFNEEKIGTFLDESGIKPEAVYLTHGHFDHLDAADALRKKYGIKVYISEKDYDLALSPSANCSEMFDEVYSFRADEKLKDGDEVSFAGVKAKVIATPGHTAGSICFYLEDEKILISGDTLFYASTGRCDLATGSNEDMQESLAKLFKLKDDIKVLPGHGAGTTIGKEKMRGGDWW